MASEFIKIEGIEKLSAFFRELPLRVEKRVLGRAVAAGAIITRDVAKTLAPIRHDDKIMRTSKRNEGRLPGFLRASIRIGRKKGQHNTGLVAQLSLGLGRAFYGMFAEFGTGPRFTKAGKYTGIEPARPWLRPAFDQSKEAATRAIINTMAVGVQREATKLAQDVGLKPRLGEHSFE